MKKFLLSLFTGLALTGIIYSFIPGDQPAMTGVRRGSLTESLWQTEPEDAPALAAGKTGGIKTIPFLKPEPEEGTAIAGYATRSGNRIIPM